MTRLLLTAILAALLWCGVEFRNIDRARNRESAVSQRTGGITVYYYVPDGTCINVHPEGDRHAQK